MQTGFTRLERHTVMANFGSSVSREYPGMDSHSEWPTAELAALLAAGVIVPPGRALDVGAGLGTEALTLARAGFRVVAIDSDKLARRELGRRRPRTDWARRLVIPQGARADALRYREARPGTFDLVIDRLLLHNLGGRDGVRLIRTIAFALRAGGHAILRRRLDRDDGKDMLGDWGQLTTVEKRLPRAVRAELHRYFVGAREARFAGLVTDASQSDDCQVLGALPMSILVCRRNSRPALRAAT